MVDQFWLHPYLGEMILLYQFAQRLLTFQKELGMRLLFAEGAAVPRQMDSDPGNRKIQCEKNAIRVNQLPYFDNNNQALQ